MPDHVPVEVGIASLKMQLPSNPLGVQVIQGHENSSIAWVVLGNNARESESRKSLARHKLPSSSPFRSPKR